MQISVDRIPDGGLIIDTQKSFETFSSLKKLSQEEACRFLSPVHLHLRARRVRRFVEVTGTIHTEIRLSCSRCLQKYQAPLTAQIEVTYTNEPSEEAEALKSDGLELTADKIGLYYFQGNEIDLRDAVQEQVILSLPISALCREACKGLCPKCGADLNEGPCGCGARPVDPRFAVLKNLKLDKE